MTDESNPYASPIAEESAAPPHLVGVPERFTVEGPYLRAIRGSEFPDRCVKCNRPAGGFRHRQTLTWYPRWVFALILVGPFLYILAALMLQKQATFAFGVCAEHRAKRRHFQLIWFGIVGLGVIAVFAAILLKNLWLAVVGAPVGTLALVVGLLGSRVVMPKEVTDTYADIRGCGPEFLASVS